MLPENFDPLISVEGRAEEYLESFISYERLDNISYDEKHFDLQRVVQFLEDFGVDYHQLKYVHVGGSKGKGSVSTLIAHYLSAAGYKTGLFTSPHILNVTERFAIDGKNIPGSVFARYVSEFREFVEGKKSACDLTYFEILTVIALKYFVDEKVDYAVLEVGLGGRLDATNIVTPVLSVLTKVEMEHVGILGNSIQEILEEKLGIKKGGVPFVVGYQTWEVETMLRERFILDKHVIFVRDFLHDFDNEAFFTCEDLVFHHSSIVQVKNAKIAMAALMSIFRKNFDIKLFCGVFEKFQMLGRFDVRKIKGKDIVFDMAHTVGSMENLIESSKNCFVGRRFVFLFSMLKGKDVDGVFYSIAGIADKVVFTSCNKERGYTGAELQNICKKNDFYNEIDCEVNEDCEKASKELLKSLKDEQVLVVTGSHFLVEKVLRKLGDIPE